MGQGTYDNSDGRFTVKEIQWRMDHLTGGNRRAAEDSICRDIDAGRAVLAWRRLPERINLTGAPPGYDKVMGLRLFEDSTVEWHMESDPFLHMVGHPQRYVIRGDCVKIRMVDAQPVPEATATLPIGNAGFGEPTQHLPKTIQAIIDLLDDPANARLLTLRQDKAAEKLAALCGFPVSTRQLQRALTFIRNRET